MTEVRFARNAAALWRRVGAEVLVALPGGTDVSVLSPAASAAWIALERPLLGGELVTALADELGIAADEVAAHLDALIEDLRRPELVVEVSSP